MAFDPISLKDLAFLRDEPSKSVILVLLEPASVDGSISVKLLALALADFCFLNHLTFVDRIMLELFLALLQALAEIRRLWPVLERTYCC